MKLENRLDTRYTVGKFQSTSNPKRYYQRIWKTIRPNPVPYHNSWCNRTGEVESLVERKKEKNGRRERLSRDDICRSKMQ